MAQEINIYFEDLNEEAQQRLKPYLTGAINVDAPISTIVFEDEENQV